VSGSLVHARYTGELARSMTAPEVPDAMPARREVSDNAEPGEQPARGTVPGVEGGQDSVALSLGSLDHWIIIPISIGIVKNFDGP